MKVKRGFCPSIHALLLSHLEGSYYTSGFLFVSELSKQFLSACIAFLHQLNITHTFVTQSRGMSHMSAICVRSYQKDAFVICRHSTIQGYKPVEFDQNNKTMKTG